MGNDRIGLQETGTPDHYLDTDSQTIDTFTVHRERNQVAGIGEDDIAVVTDAAPTIETDHGIVSWAIPPYKEDDAAPANPYGMPFLMERDDALGGVTPIAGDWTHPFCSSNGELWVKDDGANSLLTTIDADTSSMATDLGTVAGAVAGTEMQVDIVSSAALDVSAATVTVDLGANNDVTIDNSSIVHAEDAVHGTGDAGIMSLAVRNDTLAALAGTDGDYAPLQVNASGALFIQEGSALDVSAATVTVDLGANNDVTIDNSSIVQAEDAVHGSGDAGVMMLAVRQDSQVDFGADGDYVPLSIDANGAVRVTGGGGGTEYTEDVAAAGDPVGGATILVRADTPAAITSTDGDNVAQRATNYGAAYTQIVDSSGNFVDSFGGSGGTAAADDADFVAGTTQGTPAMGVYESTPSTVTDGDLGIVGISQDRRLLVDADIVAQSGAALDVSGATVTVDLGANNDVTIDNSSVVGTDGTAGPADCVSVGGTESGGNIQELRVDADGHLQIDALTTSLDGALSGSELQVDVVAALPAGTNAIGKLAANSGVDIGDVDVLSIAAGSNLVGDVGISGARTSGGTTLYRNVDVDETEDEIKGTAGQVYWIHAMNLSSSVVYLQFYNATSASVTVGTTTPDLTFPLATQGDTNGAGFTLAIPNGIEFGTAITVAATTTFGGSGGPGANEVFLNLGYA